MSNRVPQIGSKFRVYADSVWVSPGVVLDEGGLELVHAIRRAKSFNGYNLTTLCFDGQDRASVIVPLLPPHPKAALL